MNGEQPNSRKRAHGSAHRNGTTAAATGNNNKARPTKGVDTLLTIRGRRLKVGESVRLRLIKGPSVQQGADPVDATAPHESFPCLAKFGESVIRPDFVNNETWRTARLYQQEVPKPADDSEDEAEQQNDPNKPPKKKKRWRYGGDQPAPRQWILQENVDFLQTMVHRKETDGDDAGAGNTSQQQLSSRYEGIPEHNPSRFCLMRLHPSTTSPNDATLQVCLLPHTAQGTYCIIPFAQPAARKTYSLTEAEHVISDQQMGLVKTLHHMQGPDEPSSSAGDASKPSQGGANSNSAGGSTSNNPSAEGDGATAKLQPTRNPLAMRKKAQQSSKGRLLSKLSLKSKQMAASNEEEDGDDVMADVTFKKRVGGGTARKELFSTVAENVTVSDEGVLGGGNDVMFGGRQRFAQLAAPQQDKEEGAAAATADNEAEPASGGKEDNKQEGDEKAERGADGAAMADDFYQRDVKAEYDELDFEASDQFDDDDVDLMESEVVVESSNFGGGDEADDKDDDEEDEDEADEDDNVQGAQGLASLAGFKALLAKARGEAPAETTAVDEQGNPIPSNNSKKSSDYNKPQKKQADHRSKLFAATEKARMAAEQRHKPAGGGGAADTAQPEAPTDTVAAAAPAAPAPMAAAAEEQPLIDNQGLRIITLDTVRREIWLHHGSIAMKRLMKLFNIKKKYGQERQDRFRDIVKELCTMRSDPVNGSVLVLKQHYSK